MLQVLAMLVVATDPEPKAVPLIATGPEVIDKWVAAKPTERAKVKGFVDKVKINERLAFAVAVDGYELPKSRKVDLRCDVKITDSTGRDVVDRVSLLLAKTWDPKTEFAVLLKPVTALQFGTTDPEGVYQVKITVWDSVRGTHVEAETHFTVYR
jgi:hypothetical protein